MTVRILVDDRELTVKEDRSVLQACLENGIYIPNLCCMEDLPHPAGVLQTVFCGSGGKEASGHRVYGPIVGRHGRQNRHPARKAPAA